MKLSRTTVLGLALGLAVLGAATAGVVAHATASTKTITVTEREYHIALSAASAPSGRVKLVVKNTGKMPHSLAVKGPGLAMRKTALIKPGRSTTLTVTLAAGTFSLWCPVPGHAAKGMKAALHVKGGATTTDSGGGGSSGGGGTTTDAGGGGEAWG
jgi:uncharacterized cupredoxin-like copper-binding protein